MEAQIITQQEQVPVKSGKGKAVLITVGLIGLGTLGFFGYRKWKSNQEEAPTNLQEKEPSPASNYSAPKKTYSAPSVGDGFPLKRGSKGERVKAIQRFLVGKGLLEAKDIIGEFGPKTEAGLIKAGFPKAIDVNAYNTITSGEQKITTPSVSETPIDAEKFAEGLYKAALSENFNAAITILRLMKSTADYTAVSNIFKTFFLGTVRKTLVNGMLDTFSEPTQKETIRDAFKAMGLKYDGSKFSLSGIPAYSLITDTSTSVLDIKTGRVLKVSKSMILGTYAGLQGKYTKFINNGRLFLVPTTTIKFL